MGPPSAESFDGCEAESQTQSRPIVPLTVGPVGMMGMVFVLGMRVFRHDPSISPLS